MIDFEDLKEFAKMPHIFNAKIYSEIKQAISEYDGFKAYVVRHLEYYGEDAFKNPDAYTEVKYDVMNDKLPRSTEDRLLATIEHLKFQNCKQYGGEE